MRHASEKQMRPPAFNGPSGPSERWPNPRRAVSLRASATIDHTTRQVKYLQASATMLCSVLATNSFMFPLLWISSFEGRSLDMSCQYLCTISNYCTGFPY